MSNIHKLINLIDQMKLNETIISPQIKPIITKPILTGPILDKSIQFRSRSINRKKKIIKKKIKKRLIRKNSFDMLKFYNKNGVYFRLSGKNYGKESLPSFYHIMQILGKELLDYKSNNLPLFSYKTDIESNAYYPIYYKQECFTFETKSGYIFKGKSVTNCDNISNDCVFVHEIITNIGFCKISFYVCLKCMGIQTFTKDENKYYSNNN